jgi:hypothetical protein
MHLGEDRGAQRRWDGDQRGRGFADGSALAPGVDDLARALTIPDWVAERPEVHLLPHIHRACSESASDWRLRDAKLEGSVFVVELEHHGNPRPAERRAAVFALIGCFAETSTHVRERVGAAGIEYDVVTGMLDNQTPFRAHGHLVRLRLLPGTSTSL